MINIHMRFLAYMLALLTVVFPISELAYAQNAPIPTREIADEHSSECPACILAIIKKGKAAPFDGYLYNYEAFAYERAKLKFLNQEHQLKLEFETDILHTRYQLMIENLEADLAAEKQKTEGISAAKDERITELESKLIKANDDAKSDNGKLWAFVGGALLGVGAAALAVYGAAKLGETFGSVNGR